MNNNPIIVWFRQDLRLNDNPALNHAMESGRPVFPVYVFDELSPGVRTYGFAQKWWLHHSLLRLSESFEKLGGKLHLLRGPSAEVLRDLARNTCAEAICWNRRYGSGEQNVDGSVKKWAKELAVEAKSFGGMLLHEPAVVRTKTDKPYRVFTPFWKNFSSSGLVRPPFPAPGSLKFFASNIEKVALEELELLPSAPDWAVGIANEWTPGEAGAQERLEVFMAANLTDYDTMRDVPGPDRTSKLSPHLRFGEISPYQLWQACYDQRRLAGEKTREIWAKEIVWREFSYHLLHHWPNLHEKNFNKVFDNFPWAGDDDTLAIWQKGQTGYPIVDAGMRQLWQTGWMHNRVRMVVGSFLVKHLLIDWRKGERWFWDTLVDGDPAANPAQWQWVAGSGADAAPYFRVFNPILQGEKFDKDGDYVRQYVPELAAMPAKFIHKPWDAPPDILSQANVRLGENYPHPIVDHKQAREAALEAYNVTRAPVDD